MSYRLVKFHAVISWKSSHLPASPAWCLAKQTFRKDTLMNAFCMAAISATLHHVAQATIPLAPFQILGKGLEKVPWKKVPLPFSSISRIHPLCIISAISLIWVTITPPLDKSPLNCVHISSYDSYKSGFTPQLE